jgi:hypothetical protein
LKPTLKASANPEQILLNIVIAPMLHRGGSKLRRKQG